MWNALSSNQSSIISLNSSNISSLTNPSSNTSSQNQNSSQISSQNLSPVSSQNSSQISSIPTLSKDVMLADNGFVNVQMTNNSCNGFDSLQKIVVNSTINPTNDSTILNQNFIEFKATCPQTVIKTFWKDLDVNKEYRFVKYNPLLSVKKYDYPATLTKEIVNNPLTNTNKLTWVSTHTVNDNGNGDFDLTTNNIWDPYTLELVATNVVTVPNPAPTNNQNTNPIINPIATIYNWFQTTIQNLSQSIFGQNNGQNNQVKELPTVLQNQPNTNITNNNSNPNNNPTTNNNQNLNNNTNFNQNNNQGLSQNGNGQPTNLPTNNSVLEDVKTNQQITQNQTNPVNNSKTIRTGGWQTNSIVAILALLSIAGLWLIGRRKRLNW